VQGNLPLRTPSGASGKSGQSRVRASGPDIGTIISLRQPPPAAPAKKASGSLWSTRLVALTSFGFIVGLCRFRRPGLGVVRLWQLPSCHALQHAVGVLDGVHVSIVGFNHVDGSSHLLGQEIYVHAFLQPERGVGVTEAIGRARDALGAFAQFCFVQKMRGEDFVWRRVAPIAWLGGLSYRE